MSFLESLKLKQSNLKSTVTFLTCADGKVYKETKSGIEYVGNKSGYVIDNKPDSKPAKIIDFLFLGSQDCCDEIVIQKYNIKYVLSIGVDISLKHPNVTYKFIECLDLPEFNLKTIIWECIPFIRFAISQCSNVLVHCNAGVSRSASIVIAYLMLIENLSYLDAYICVKQARKCINPNAGFIKQLQSLT